MRMDDAGEGKAAGKAFSARGQNQGEPVRVERRELFERVRVDFHVGGGRRPVQHPLGPGDV